MTRVGIRGRLLLVVVATVAVAVAAFIVGFNLILADSLDTSSKVLLRSRAASEAALLKFADGRLVIADASDRGRPAANVWVFASRRVLEQPRAGRAIEAAARSLVGGPARFLDVQQAESRLYAEPIIRSGRRVGTVVVGIGLSPYEETRTVAIDASIVFGGIVLLLVAFAARWLLASSLRPVRRMTRQAATWSELELDQRFQLGVPHDELTELAGTLDGLLDRLAASLRHEQRFSAELSHELRTPIARVLAEAELALRRDRPPEEYRAALETIHRSAQQLAKIVDALMAAARHEAGSSRGTADAYAVATEAAAACGGLMSEQQVTLDVETPAHPARLGVDPDLAERILQPILENACRYGATHVRVSIEREGSSIRYVVADDGPGIASDEGERIFEPGIRGRLGEIDGAEGAGLGLSLARRLARSSSGDVVAIADAAGGRFLIRLPAA